MADGDGGGMIEAVEPERPKRTLTPEQLAKMQEGRARVRAARKSRKKRSAKPDRTKQSFPGIGGVAERLPDTGPAPRPGPVSFPRPVPQIDEDVAARTPRLVRLADAKETLDGFWPLLMQRFPSAQKDMVRALFGMASRGVRHRLYRTDGGLALFEQRQTAWEPEIAIVTVFAIGRDTTALIDAGIAWAEAIGAARFESDRPVGGGRETAFWTIDLRERKALSLA